MTITYKTAQEIADLREGGKILADILQTLVNMAKVGVTTREIDQAAERLIRQAGGEPAFKGYRSDPSDPPYPSTICASINEGLVHCPATDRALKDGDILSIDIGMRYKKLFTDMATTVAIGVIPAKTQQLLDDTKTSLQKGIAAARLGGCVADISKAIESFLAPQGYGIIKNLVGHGVGYAVHEEPRVPNFYRSNQPHVELKPGLVIAIEPMVCLGDEEIVTADDGWSINMADGSLSAHEEHTIAVTENGIVVITAL